MEKPGRHIMLDNLASGITSNELKYLITVIGATRFNKLLCGNAIHTLNCSTNTNKYGTCNCGSCARLVNCDALALHS